MLTVSVVDNWLQLFSLCIYIYIFKLWDLGVLSLYLLFYMGVDKEKNHTGLAFFLVDVLVFMLVGGAVTRPFCRDKQDFMYVGVRVSVIGSDSISWAPLTAICFDFVVCLIVT